MKRSAAARVALVVAAGVVLAAGLSACGGDDGGATGAAALPGTVWVLTSYVDGTATSQVPSGVRVDASFATSTISGRAPVNTYTGPYTTSGDSAIEIGPLASTMMAGPKKAMDLERAFFDALQRATSYSVDGDTLELADAGGATLLTFTAEAPPSLSGSVWRATGYNNGREAVVSLAKGSEITALFSDADSVSGSSGINTYSGSYSADESRIEIGELATTQKAGPDDLMQQETEYLAALRSAATWSIRGDTLELRTADDAIAVTYTWAGPPD